MECKVKISDKTVTLGNLPQGSLFYYDDTLCLKTEYSTDKGLMECFIVGSGEFFSAGVKNRGEQEALLVRKVKIKRVKNET